jgi:hypothetical protein
VVVAVAREGDIDHFIMSGIQRPSPSYSFHRFVSLAASKVLVGVVMGKGCNILETIMVVVVVVVLVVVLWWQQWWWWYIFTLLAVVVVVVVNVQLCLAIQRWW